MLLKILFFFNFYCPIYLLKIEYFCLLLLFYIQVNYYKNMNIQLIASKFNGRCKDGDFDYMIKQDMKSETDPRTLYIYNDNTESYYSHSYKIGAGNAIIRPYNQFNPNIQRPFSAGIPTGSLEHGGFDELSSETIQVINGSIKLIELIIKKHSIKTIYYSTNDETGLLGKALFDVDNEVLLYITNKLKQLVDKLN